MRERMRSLLGRRTRLGVVVGVAVALVAAAGIAYASIPDSNGVIHGCYKKTTGSLRVIDGGGKGCQSGERPLDWNQAGAAGVSLFANVDEDGTLLSGTATGSSHIGAGHYMVTFDRDVTACAPVASSGKVPGSADGIPLATFLLHNDDTANPNDVEVYLIIPFQGTAVTADAAFHLVVAC